MASTPQAEPSTLAPPPVSSDTSQSWQDTFGPEEPTAVRYEQCQEKDVPGVETKAYLSVLRACKMWDAPYTQLGGEVSVATAPGVTATMTVAGQNAPGPRRAGKSLMGVREAPIEARDLGEGYLYSFKAKEEAKHDALDRQFLAGYEQAETEGSLIHRRVFYGLHTYGGFYGFFRPDLAEVIRLISAAFPAAALAPYAALYVTTEMHPTDNIRDVYDQRRDRHRAKTTVWSILKPAADAASTVAPAVAPTVAPMVPPVVAPSIAPS
jgi:hypothetical protein